MVWASGCEFRAAYSDSMCTRPEDAAWRRQNIEGYVAGNAPLLSVRYLGLWDTVCALGVPAIVPFSGFLNRKLSCGIMLKGNGFAYMRLDVAALAIFVLAAMALALFRFRSTLY